MPKQHKKKSARQVKVVVKTASPARRAPRARPSARGGTSEAQYVRALYDPFNSAPCRFPDMLSIPTGVTSSVVRLGIAAVNNGGATASCIRVNVFPHVGSTSIAAGTANAAKISYGLTYDTAQVPLTFAYLNDPLRGTGLPNTGAAFANWASYRTVAMGLRIRNVTPLLSRGGTVAMRMSLSPAGDLPDVYSYGQISSARESEIFDAASIPAAGRYIVWHPENYTQDVNFADTTVSNYQPMLQFAYSGPASNFQQFYIEVVTFYEFAPRPETEMLFDTQCVVGSPAKVEMLVSEMRQAVPDTDTANAGYAEKASSFLNRHLGTVSQIASVGAAAAQHYRHLRRAMDNIVIRDNVGDL